MTLFSKDQLKQLLENGSPEKYDLDHIPVAKLFLPGTGCTWLITELDSENNDIAFGLCDLGMGHPELGYVSISELTDVKTNLGLSVESDLHFSTNIPLSAYAAAARSNGYIVEDVTILKSFQLKKSQSYDCG